MNRAFEVGVYEPYVDPGGYTAVFVVNACCEHTARSIAIQKLRDKYPSAGRIEVYKMLEKQGDLVINSFGGYHSHTYRCGHYFQCSALGCVEVYSNLICDNC